MKILLVGNGGREHAIARALARTSTTDHPVELVVQAGNPGLERLGESRTLDPLDPDDVLRRALGEQVDLVVVGPEAPLVAGIADAVLERGVPVFGPTRAAARLEASKSFAKQVMAAAGVATAASRTCRTIDEAGAALDAMGSPYVVKDDALAAGKGVVVTGSRDEALAHAAACLARQGGAVVIEEYLDGPEVSLFCLSDGATALPLVPAQDFKRAGDGGTGPNTGGMGAYSPLTWAPDDLTERVVREIAQPVVDEMARRGTAFIGLLYCGLALTSDGLRVVEFNVRFGDPETQAVLARLTSSLPDLLLAAASGRLADAPAPTWSEQAAVDVVLAAPGYPGTVAAGGAVTGVEEAETLPGVHVLHAGTGFDDDGRLVAAGGRVLSVVALADTVGSARDRAYEAVSRIHLDGGQYRTDIAAGR